MNNENLKVKESISYEIKRKIKVLQQGKGQPCAKAHAMFMTLYILQSFLVAQ